MLPERRDQLLSYLAHVGDWVERHRIARLLWSELDDTAALRNLRHLLHVASRDGTAPELIATRRALRVDTTVDTSDFTAAVAAEDWDYALAIYRGPFLAGMEETAEGAFGNWLQVEREHLRSLRRRAALQAVEALTARGDSAGTAALLEPLLADDPLDEVAVRALATALAKSGDRARALAVLQRFERALERDLGMAPVAATRALATAVREGMATTRQAREAEPSAVELVGREQELAMLLSWFEQGVRVATIIGPSGVGKSALAAEVAARAGPVIGRFVTVALESADRASHAVTTIATALGIPPGEREVDLDSLAARLSEQPTLLVLDAVDRVTGLAGFAAELLRRVPDTRLLLTSQVRLHLPGERLQALAGLAHETSDDRPDISELPAVALFVGLVRRHEPRWEPDRDELLAVQSIARSVAGLPLALELAAPWIRTLSVEAIAREVGSDLDFLNEPHRVGPTRQRSLRATFEHAWAYAGETERAALPRLSVFDGGFLREAASVVAGAPLPVLASLVEASLLRRRGARFEQHTLLRRFALEKLAADPEAADEVRRRHAYYYADLLRTRFPAHGFARPAALAMVDDEHPNLVAAWTWALENRALDVMEPLAEALSWWCELRGRASEGVAYLDGAIHADATETWLPRRLLARLLVKRAWLRHWLAHEAADDDAARALKLARGARDGLTAAAALRVLGLGSWRVGRYAEAEQRLGSAIAIAVEDESDVWLATLLDGHGLALSALGRFEESEAAQQRAFGLNSRIGNAYQTVQNLINLSSHARRRGDLAGAAALAAEAARSARESGFSQYLPHALTQLATCQFDAGDPAAALVSATEAVSLAEAGGDTYVRVWSALQLARVAAGAGQATLAAGYLHQGIAAASRSGDRKQLIQGLVVAAAVATSRGEGATARRWSRTVDDDDGTPTASRMEARKLLARLGAVDAPDELASDAVPTVATVIDEVLAAAARWRI